MRATPPADSPTPELEPDAAAMRALVAEAMTRICAHIEALPRMPACDVAGGAELARALREGVPADGCPFEHVLALLFDRAVPCSFNTAGPGYLAYIPGGGIYGSFVIPLEDYTIEEVRNQARDAATALLAGEMRFPGALNGSPSFEAIFDTESDPAGIRVSIYGLQATFNSIVGTPVTPRTRVENP